MEETRKYKQTELGLLPEDWEVAKLGEIGAIAMCKRIFQNETSEMGDVPFYKIGTFGKAADAYISYAKYNEFKSAYRFPNKGDILISAAGTIGRIVVYDGKPAYFQDSNIVWLAHNGKTIRNDFLFYVYQITEWNTENTTIARLYNDNFNNTIIPLPPIEEQRRIASALTSIDNFIDSLDRLIAKKRDIKQGAMQQLLSGKKRLKGFTEPWVQKKLGDIADTASGGTPSRSNIDYYKGNICWFTTSELTDNYLYDSNEHITNEALLCSSAKLFPAGILLIAMYGATIGKLGILCKEAATNQACCAIKCHKIDTKFLFYLLLLNRPNIIELGCGAGQPNISQDIIRNLEFIVPSSLPEQQAIASVLTSIDNELTALEAKRKKYEQIKQGMMQQLLTGRIRLLKAEVKTDTTSEKLL